MNGFGELRFMARLAIVVSVGALSACAGDYGSSRTASNQQASAPSSSSVSADLVTKAQTLLTDLGFEPGPVDGEEGPRTASAISAYQGAAGLTKDGRVSAGLVDHLSAAVDRRQVVRAQSRLAELGYDPGPVDGYAGARTRGAVQEFQGAEGLTPDGQVTPDLLAALDSVEAKSAAATAEAPAEPEVAEAQAETATTETATAEVAAAAAAATAGGAAATQAAATGETEAAAAETAAESAAENSVETAGETAAEETAEKAEEVAALAADDQTLKAGDRVQLSYLGAEQKSQELEIGQDGLLAVPDAGSVEAAGLDIDELRDKVTVTLIESYMDKIDIDVGLLQAAEAGDGATDTLAAGDHVLVSLSGAKTASSELEVAADGSLDVPEAGSIQAAGLGLAQLKEEIGVKLLESYMSELDVTVEQIK